MKRNLIAVGLLVVVCFVAVQAQVPNATEQEVLRVEQAQNDAFLKKDRASYEQLLADDYVYIHSNGTVTNKTQEIADTMSADNKWTASKLENLKVRIYGDVAVVTGAQTLTGSSKGYVAGPRRITDLWVRRNRRWQTIGGQTTLAPAAK
jgi:ketosteroid isomerase-like protein